MSSIAAKKVAEEVLETMAQGKIASVKRIARKHGYPKTTAKSGLIQKTKTFQEVINEGKKPILERMIIERDRAMKAMKGKISKAKYRDLMDAIDKLTKNIQLLSGGLTEDVKITWGE